MKLEAQNLTWSARQLPIVSDVSVSIKSGEMFGLIGPNGSGKSTLMRMLAGLSKPQKGVVELDGISLKQTSRRQIAQKLAFVEQQAETQDLIKVRDAVELGRTCWLSAISPWSAHDTYIVDTALRSVDMYHMANRSWHTLSGGERQRVHIARALAQEPSVLLLDEPTNHLDISYQVSILDLVTQLDTTTVVALHDLNQAFKCDRIGVMQAGKMIAIGTPEEILKPKFLEEVFGVCVHTLIDPNNGKTVLSFHSVSSGREHNMRQVI
ncbi:ABC transporter ATP-binding protein [Amylibacter sp. SFDW26]|uniref:ABC transporter ATP-binding protein n=1 Tax=Amylibacter sp. SFDW26 TaxID=2652722 RepID=UPI001261E0A5|nr:ABC transporter ATP-binding protein [Amylibacter sp. SFDW26]KAB7613901.1 ABC transporter ATP-binding protein [Amylibacter sp. SFDW26]